MTIQHAEMSPAEIEAFLAAPRFAVVGTSRLDGPPQQTPVWYLYEKRQIYVSMLVRSAKFRNLKRDPRVSVCIAGEHPDARAVIFTGTAELYVNSGVAWIDELTWRLVRRYYESDEKAQAYLDNESDTGQSALAVITPDKIIAHDYN